jgi:8-oxo-dGTP pyrophosphatase MutT (NUDIX family)
MRFAVARDEATFVFSATPGGSVKAGETDLEAARRELKEELALTIALLIYAVEHPTLCLIVDAVFRRRCVGCDGRNITRSLV